MGEDTEDVSSIVAAAVVAHEVNNPLAYVSLGFDSLERLVQALPEQERGQALGQIGEMRAGIERVAAITRDLRTALRLVARDPSVDSELGRGAKFRVAPPVAAPGVGPAVAGSRSIPRAHILVVDDEPAIARSLGALLSAEHEVEVLTSGADALARILGGETYDVVLCDLMMPDVSGIDLHVRLAKERPGEEAKIVFMTGGAFTESARSFLASVPNRCLEKPFPIAQLNALLAELLG